MMNGECDEDAERGNTQGDELTGRVRGEKTKVDGHIIIAENDAANECVCEESDEFLLTLHMHPTNHAFFISPMDGLRGTRRCVHAVNHCS